MSDGSLDGFHGRREGEQTLDSKEEASNGLTKKEELEYQKLLDMPS